MSLVLMDGFDYLINADSPKRGWASGGSAFGVASAGRRSTKALQIGQIGTSYAQKWLPGNHGTLVAGVAFTANAEVSTQVWSLLSFSDGDSLSSGVQMAVRHNTATNCLEVWRGTTFLAADTLALLRNQYYYLEFKAVLHGSAGSYELRVGGVTRLSASGINTLTTANAYANVLRLGSTATYRTGSGGAQIYYHLDDLYVCDDAGSVNNDFLGDCRIDLITPTAEGNYSDFTPSTGADNAALVGEATLNTSDYNGSQTPGHRDSFNMADLGSLMDNAVFGVQTHVNANVSEDGSRAIAPFIRVGTTDYDDAYEFIGTTHRYLSTLREVNPNGDVPWTRSSVNGAEFGYRIAV